MATVSDFSDINNFRRSIQKTALCQCNWRSPSVAIAHSFPPFFLIGIQTSQNAKFYALSAEFDKFSNEGKTVVVQFTVKHEQKIDCGGGYVKVWLVCVCVCVCLVGVCYGSVCAVSCGVRDLFCWLTRSTLFFQN